MLPCFYEHERSYSPVSNTNPHLFAPIFAGAPSNPIQSSQPHPSSSQLILEILKDLSTFLDPKTLVSTIIRRSFLQSGFSGKFRSRFSLYWSFSKLFLLEKEPYVWLVVIEPFALKLRTPSHLVHIRCLFFCLSFW